MDVDIELLVEVLGDPVCCPACGVFSFFGRVPFQETLDFLLDLVGDLLRASAPLSVVEAGRAFFVEPVEPFVDHRAGNVVDLRDLRSRVSSTA